MSDADLRLWHELAALRSRLREVLEGALAAPSAPLVGGLLEPPVDVWETATEVVVEAELPGVRVSELDLRIEDETLVLSGSFATAPDSGGRALRIERPHGRFARAIPLPVAVAGEPSASLKAGVLRVRIPKQGSGRRRVPVEREGP